MIIVSAAKRFVAKLETIVSALETSISGVEMIVSTTDTGGFVCINTLNDVPADFASTTRPGAGPVTVNIGTPGQNGQVSFSGTAGQRMSLQTTGTSISSSLVKIQQNPALLPFTAGQQYSIEMQYYQGIGGTVARLRWSSPSTQKQIIPQTQLTPAGGPAGTGLKGEYYSNTSLTGTPTLTRTDATVNFDWRGSTPGGAVPTTNWSARWTDPDTQ